MSSSRGAEVIPVNEVLVRRFCDTFAQFRMEREKKKKKATDAIETGMPLKGHTQVIFMLY